MAETAAHVAIVAFQGQLFGHAGAASHTHTVIDRFDGVVGGSDFGGNDRRAEFQVAVGVLLP